MKSLRNQTSKEKILLDAEWSGTKEVQEKRNEELAKGIDFKQAYKEV